MTIYGALTYCYQNNLKIILRYSNLVFMLISLTGQVWRRGTKCDIISLTISAAHALKAIRWHSLLLLFRYLKLTKTYTVMLYSL